MEYEKQATTDLGQSSVFSLGLFATPTTTVRRNKSPQLSQPTTKHSSPFMASYLKRTNYFQERVNKQSDLISTKTKVISPKNRSTSPNNDGFVIQKWRPDTTAEDTTNSPKQSPNYSNRRPSIFSKLCNQRKPVEIVATQQTGYGLEQFPRFTSPVAVRSSTNTVTPSSASANSLHAADANGSRLARKSLLDSNNTTLTLKSEFTDDISLADISFSTGFSMPNTDRDFESHDRTLEPDYERLHKLRKRTAVSDQSHNVASLGVTGINRLLSSPTVEPANKRARHHLLPSDDIIISSTDTSVGDRKPIEAADHQQQQQPVLKSLQQFVHGTTGSAASETTPTPTSSSSRAKLAAKRNNSILSSYSSSRRQANTQHVIPNGVDEDMEVSISGATPVIPSIHSKHAAESKDQESNSSSKIEDADRQEEGGVKNAESVRDKVDLPSSPATPTSTPIKLAPRKAATPKRGTRITKEQVQMHYEMQERRLAGFFGTVPDADAVVTTASGSEQQATSVQAATSTGAHLKFLSVTTQLPSAITQLPSAITQLPPAITQLPSATTQLPPATTQLPPATTQLPSVTQIPSVTTQLPSVTTQVPSVTTQLPPATTQLPSATTQLPPVTTQIPSVTTQLPSRSIQAPVTSPQSPFTTLPSQQAHFSVSTSKAQVPTLGVGSSAPPMAAAVDKPSLMTAPTLPVGTLFGSPKDSLGVPDGGVISNSAPATLVRPAAVSQLAPPPPYTPPTSMSKPGTAGNLFSFGQPSSPAASNTLTPVAPAAQTSSTTAAGPASGGLFTFGTPKTGSLPQAASTTSSAAPFNVGATNLFQFGAGAQAAVTTTTSSTGTSQAPAAPALFSFGVPLPTAATSSTTPFSFTAKPSSLTTGAASATTTTSTTSVVKPSFVFGGANDTKLGVTSEAQGVSGPMFGSATTAQSVSTASTSKSSGTFTFGSSTGTNLPLFGSSSSTNMPVFGTAAKSNSSGNPAPAASGNPIFAASATTANPTFGTASNPAFGAASTAGKSTFGAASAGSNPTFSAVSNPVFGSASPVSNSAFGSASTGSNSAFGTASTGTNSAFGTASTASGVMFGGTSKPNDAIFGGGAASNTTFGSSNPVFGAVGNTKNPVFGGTGTTTANPTFGNQGGSAFTFGAGASKPDAVSANKTVGFSFGNAAKSGSGGTASVFGAAPAVGFGTPQAASGGTAAGGGGAGVFKFGGGGGGAGGSSGPVGGFKFNAAPVTPQHATSPFAQTAAPAAGGMSTPVVGGGMFSIGSGSTRPRATFARGRRTTRR